MAKIAIIIDTSISMTDSGTDNPGALLHGGQHRPFLKDYPMGALAIDIGKRIADDSGSPLTSRSPTTVDIFGFDVGGSGPSTTRLPRPKIHGIPQQYTSFDEIPEPAGGTPMTECLEYLIDQDYDKIYAISDGMSNRPATGPWPDNVATIFVIPTIELVSNTLEGIVHYDPHTAATIIAAFIL